MLNPEFWLDEEVSTLSPHARLLYMGLWGICDDNHATFPNRPSWIKIQIFPYESVSIPLLLTELEEIGKIFKFTAEDSEWYWIKNFLKHQRVERPSRPKYPKYIKPPLPLTESSPTTRSEVKRSKEKIVLLKAKLPLQGKEELQIIKEVDEDTEPRYERQKSPETVRVVKYFRDACKKQLGEMPPDSVAGRTLIKRALTRVSEKDCNEKIDEWFTRSLTDQKLMSITRCFSDNEINGFITGYAK